MAKNILIFSDGTGQLGGIRPDQRLSNIYKMYRAMRPGPESPIAPHEQIAFYDPGLGSTDGRAPLLQRIRNILGSTFGTGISVNIADCYEAIIKHYEEGDRIFLFGFSRGAYTARCVANTLNLCGVPRYLPDGRPVPRYGPTLRKIAEEGVFKVYEHGSGKNRARYEAEREEQARRFRARYGSEGNGLDGEAQGNVAPTFIGVFDTVAALGTVIVRRVLAGILVVSITFAAISWLFVGSWFAAVAATPAIFLFFAFLGAVRKQFKYIWGGPSGKKFSWHFAAWNLTNYDRFLDNSVGYARHALSIDENRKRFPQVGWGYAKDVARMERKSPPWLKQVWFAGVHSDIGGSYPEDESRLSDVALRWMLDELRSIPEPPRIKDNLIETYPCATGLQHDEVQGSRDSWFPGWWPRVLRFGWLEAHRSIDPDADLHKSVIERLESANVPQYDNMKPYRPTGLRIHHQTPQYYASDG
jgi:uncharacterized protein (DUF2235 family)